MAKYKLFGEGVQDTERGNRVIPNAPGNRHWREYLEWVDDGNVADPEFTPVELLSDAKVEKRQAIRAEGLSRIEAIYPGLGNQAMLGLVKDVILSIAPAARQLQPDLITVRDIFDAGQAAVVVINALGVLQDVLDYDPVTDPSWP